MKFGTGTGRGTMSFHSDNSNPEGRMEKAEDLINMEPSAFSSLKPEQMQRRARFKAHGQAPRAREAALKVKMLPARQQRLQRGQIRFLRSYLAFSFGLIFVSSSMSIWTSLGGFSARRKRRSSGVTVFP